ncbi:hypothetical protein MBLNU459_g0202t1 [Dothideomycetes sp. NU459]
MSNQGESYALGRDFLAQHRLNYQHTLWRQTFGYYIHPSIPTTSDQTLRIADVATGSAIWLLEVAETLPSPTTRLSGFDISSQQYPPSTFLPSNVELGTFDMMDPAGPPAHLQGKFDIVHVRLLACIIRDNNVAPALSALIKLLKPGGYLQWEEGDMANVKAAGAGGGKPPPAIEAFVDIARNFQDPKWSWITDLAQTFADSGMQDVVVDRRREKPWMRGLWNDNYCLLFSENAQHVAKQDEAKGKKMIELLERMIEEKDTGAYFEYPMQIVVGKKSSDAT